MDETARNCEEVLKIVNGKNFKKHTCYDCEYLLDTSGKCEKKHKTVLYVFKFGPVKNGVYHRDTKTWICKDKKFWES